MRRPSSAGGWGSAAAVLPTLVAIAGAMALAVPAATAVMVGTTAAPTKEAMHAEMIAIAGWTVFALLAVRNVPIFALVAAPVICRQAWAALEPLTRGLTTTMDETAIGRRLLNGGLAAVLILACLAWAVVQLNPKRSQDHLKSLVPLAAFAALKQSHPAGLLFNDYNWGGYVLWDLYPEYPSFVDGRTDVFTPQIFEDYIRLWNAQAGWDPLLESYGVDIVFLPPEAPLVDTLVHAGWEESYRDGSAVILLRPQAEG